MSMGHVCSRCEDLEEAITANDEAMQKMSIEILSLVATTRDQALKEAEGLCRAIAESVTSTLGEHAAIECANAIGAISGGVK